MAGIDIGGASNSGGPPKASLDGQAARQGQARLPASYIFFCWVRGLEFWLFTLYDKNELSALSKKDRATLESLLKIELKMRKWV